MTYRDRIGEALANGSRFASLYATAAGDVNPPAGRAPPMVRIPRQAGVVCPIFAARQKAIRWWIATWYDSTCGVVS